MKEEKGVDRILSILNISLSQEQKYLQKTTDCVDVLKKYLEKNQNKEAELLEKLAANDLLIQELKDRIQHTKEKYKLKLRNLKENYEKLLEDEREKNSSLIRDKKISSENIEPMDVAEKTVPKPCLVPHEKRPLSAKNSTELFKDIESKKARIDEPNEKTTQNMLKTPAVARVKDLVKPCHVKLFQIEVVTPKPAVTNQVDYSQSEMPDLSVVKSDNSEGEEEEEAANDLIKASEMKKDPENSPEISRTSPKVFAKPEVDKMMAPGLISDFSLANILWWSKK